MFCKIYGSGQELDGKEWRFGSVCRLSKVLMDLNFFSFKAVDLRTKVHPFYTLVLLTSILMCRFKTQQTKTPQSGCAWLESK